MIQRQQTLWLILSFIAALLSFVFPFATGNLVENNTVTIKTLDAGSDFLLLVLTGICLVIAGITIFLYRNRKQQGWLCIAGAVVSAGILVMYGTAFSKLSSGTLALSSILPLMMFLGFILAWRNIRKDEKLIKSLDKLR